MALMKLCSRCQKVIDYNKRICIECEEKVGSSRAIGDKLYQEYRTDDRYQKVYKSSLWKRVRRVAITRANGLCEVCIKKGKINYIDDVHHIVPIKINIKKAYDVDNLICLCRQCHIDAHKGLIRQGEGLSKKF